MTYKNDMIYTEDIDDEYVCLEAKINDIHKNKVSIFYRYTRKSYT